MREGDVLELQLTRTDFAGRSHAQREALSLEVAGGFAGERVDARLLELNRRGSLGRARVLNVLAAREGRVEPACERHPDRGGRCDGCGFMALSLDAQRALKREMLAELGLSVDAVEGDSRDFGYRHSAKRVAFGKPGGLWLGSFRRGTHKGARMDGCRVDHPLLERAASAVEVAAREAGVAAYDERTRAGDLRYVWLRTDGQSRTLVTLVTAAEHSLAAERLAKDLPEDIGVAWSVQAAATNAMRGTSASVLREPGEIEMWPLGHAARVGPLGFLQPNPPLAERCYQALVGDTRGALAVDLYAGAGATTAELRQRFERVVVSELHPESAAALGAAPESAEQTLERLLDAGETPQLVIANPPRAGLRDAAVALLRKLAAPRVHVMSCGPEGLARDLAALEEGGLYRRASLRAFDTLPQTPHVELVVQLELAGG